MGMDELSLLVFAACIVLFILDVLPMATTAILGCVTMVILGICNFQTAFGQFSSSAVVLTIGVMIIGAAISNVGLADIIGEWIVRVSKGSESKLIVGTYIAATLMSAFLTNSAVLAIFIPIIMGVANSGNGIKCKNLIMPIAYGCVIGGTTTLVGSTQQMTAQGLLIEAGAQSFKIFDFVPVGGILAMAGLFYCLFVGRQIGEKLWGIEHRDRASEAERSMVRKPVLEDKTKMIIMAVIFGLTVVLYVTEWIPVAATSTIAALICIITGCISQDQAIKSVNWNIVGRLGGCLGMAKALESAGGTQLISSWFQTVVGVDANPYLLFCIFVLFVQVASEFTSNSTAILIVLPVMLSVAPMLNLNSYTFALGITIASGVVLSSPLASSTLGMSMVVGYKFTDYFKYSVAYDILAYILVVTIVPFFYGLTV